MERDLVSVQRADDKAAVYPALSTARLSSKYSTGLDSSRLQLLPVAPANTTLILQMKKWGRAVMWLTLAHERWTWKSSETLIPSELLNSDIIKKQIVQRFQWIVLKTKVTNTLNLTLPNYCVFYSSLCPQVYSCLSALMGCHHPSLPNCFFSDVTVGAWNQPWWDYLHQRNQKTPRIRGFFFWKPTVKH